MSSPRPGRCGRPLLRRTASLSFSASSLFSSPSSLPPAHSRTDDEDETPSDSAERFQFYGLGPAHTVRVASRHHLARSFGARPLRPQIQCRPGPPTTLLRRLMLRGPRRLGSITGMKMNAKVCRSYYSSSSMSLQSHLHLRRMPRDLRTKFMFLKRLREQARQRDLTWLRLCAAAS